MALKPTKSTPETARTSSRISTDPVRSYYAQKQSKKRKAQPVKWRGAAPLGTGGSVKVAAHTRKKAK